MTLGCGACKCPCKFVCLGCEMVCLMLLVLLGWLFGFCFVAIFLFLSGFVKMLTVGCCWFICWLSDKTIIEWKGSWKKGGVGEGVVIGWGLKRVWERCGGSSQVWCSVVLHCRVIHGMVLKGLMGYVGVLRGKLACHSLIRGMARSVGMDGVLVVSVSVACGRVCV